MLSKIEYTFCLPTHYTSHQVFWRLVIITKSTLNVVAVAAYERTKFTVFAKVGMMQRVGA